MVAVEALSTPFIAQSAETSLTKCLFTRGDWLLYTGQTMQDFFLTTGNKWGRRASTATVRTLQGYRTGPPGLPVWVLHGYRGLNFGKEKWEQVFLKSKNQKWQKTSSYFLMNHFTQIFMFIHWISLRAVQCSQYDVSQIFGGPPFTVLAFLQKLGCQKPFLDQARLSSLVWLQWLWLLMLVICNCFGNKFRSFWCH